MEKENQKTILLVEDEENLSSITADVLESEGFNVIKAKNGEEGLKNALEFKPDLILTDIIMPVMDGITMLRKLRENEWGKTAKVIILSNLGDPEEINKAMSNEVFDYLIKVSWGPKELVELVKKKLG